MQPFLFILVVIAALIGIWVVLRFLGCCLLKFVVALAILALVGFLFVAIVHC